MNTTVTLPVTLNDEFVSAALMSGSIPDGYIDPFNLAVDSLAAEVVRLDIVEEKARALGKTAKAAAKGMREALTSKIAECNKALDPAWTIEDRLVPFTTLVRESFTGLNLTSTERSIKNRQRKMLAVMLTAAFNANNEDGDTPLVIECVNLASTKAPLFQLQIADDPEEVDPVDQLKEDIKEMLGKDHARALLILDLIRDDIEMAQAEAAERNAAKAAKAAKVLARMVS